MAQFSNTDNAANSVFWAAAQLGQTANASNRTLLFGNTTNGGYFSGRVDGQYGVDNAEAAVDNGGLVRGIVIITGTGYTANAVVTLTVVNGGSSGTANATANSTGKISALNVDVAGDGYKVAPTVSIAAPANTTFNANSAVTAGENGGANSVITISSAPFFVINDVVKYQVATNNTAIEGLTSGSDYYIQFANSTVVALANSISGSRITLTKGLTQTGHALTGVQATGAVVIGGAKNTGVAHAGWVLRTTGTGGRAGRVQTETLVAMGSMGGDASDDTIYPDT